MERLAWFPVPLPAFVALLIAAGQAETVISQFLMLGQIAPVFVLYRAGAAALGLALSRLLQLPVDQARTLVFSLAPRNSSVVLPFALALPSSWELAVIVFQPLVELFGIVVFIWLVPRPLLPAAPSS